MKMTVLTRMNLRNGLKEGGGGGRRSCVPRLNSNSAYSARVEVMMCRGDGDRGCVCCVCVCVCVCACVRGGGGGGGKPDLPKCHENDSLDQDELEEGVEGGQEVVSAKVEEQQRIQRQGVGDVIDDGDPQVPAGRPSIR